MNTTITKFLLPLAALALGSVACDPFPAKPGGDPAIVRVITYGGAGGASNTVETVTGGNTVSTDFAQPDDYHPGPVQQAHGRLDHPEVPAVQRRRLDVRAARRRRSLHAGGHLRRVQLPGRHAVCFDPSSATDGALGGDLPGRPAGLRHHLHRGRHREGLRGQVAHPQRQRHGGQAAHPVRRGRLHHRRRLVRLRRRQLRGPLVARPARPAATCRWPSSTRRSTATASVCEVLHHELVPDTDYWYQVKETTGPPPPPVRPRRGRAARSAR